MLQAEVILISACCCITLEMCPLLNEAKTVERTVSSEVHLCYIIEIKRFINEIIEYRRTGSTGRNHDEK